MNIKYESKKYEIVATDITNHCNARCVFCFNSFGKAACMSKDIFLKALSALPFTEDIGYYFSCLYEPTLHPQFLEFLNTLPRQYKKNIFYTTNLVKHMSDEDFRMMANSNVQHINISLETFDADLYEQLTSVKNSHFYDNLERLCKIFSEYPSAPKIRFITMILKQNQDELMSIYETARTKYAPFQHEFRTPYFYYYDESSESLRDLLLTKQQADSLRCRFDEQICNHDNMVYEVEMYTEKYDELLKQRKTSVQSATDEVPSHRDLYTLRINADGSGTIAGEEFNLCDIDNPFLFFAEKLLDVQKKEADLFSVNQKPLKMFQDANIEIFIDSMTVYDNEYVRMQGWVYEHNRPANANGSYKKCIVISSDETEQSFTYRTRTVQRFDVAQHFNDDFAIESGFDFVFELEKVRALSSGKVDILIGILKDDSVFTYKKTTFHISGDIITQGNDQSTIARMTDKIQRKKPRFFRTNN